MFFSRSLFPATNDPTSECTSDSCHEQCNGVTPPKPPVGSPSGGDSSSSISLVTLLLLLVTVAFVAGVS